MHRPRWREDCLQPDDAIPFAEYPQIVDWTGRTWRNDKRFCHPRRTGPDPRTAVTDRRVLDESRARLPPRIPTCRRHTGIHEQGRREARLPKDVRQRPQPRDLRATEALDRLAARHPAKRDTHLERLGAYQQPQRIGLRQGTGADAKFARFASQLNVPGRLPPCQTGSARVS